MTVTKSYFLINHVSPSADDAHCEHVATSDSHIFP